MCCVPVEVIGRFNASYAQDVGTSQTGRAEGDSSDRCAVLFQLYCRKVLPEVLLRTAAKGKRVR
jgi:hypothetical protein